MRVSIDEFERLALEQLDMLYRVARRLTREHSSAEDLVQETYLRAVRGRDSFDLQDHGIRPWLIRIMHNLHFTRSQRERRQPMKLGDDVLNAAPDVSSIAPLKISPAMFEQFDERIVAALDELPEDYRVVMLLWAVEEMSYKEIAESVDVPIGTVMSRLYRARTRLSEKLQQFSPRTTENSE